MKINENYVRDILIYCEEHIEVKILKSIPSEYRIKPVRLTDLFESSELSQIDNKEIVYTILKLYEADFIQISNIQPVAGKSISNCDIADITYKGHCFLNTIRPENIWEKTKSVVSKIGNHTLEFIEQTAHDVAVECSKEMIKNTTGLL